MYIVRLERLSFQPNRSYGSAFSKCFERVGYSTGKRRSFYWKEAVIVSEEATD